MKTASVADLRNHFRRISAWIENGESVAITRRGRVVARLVPPAPEPTADRPFQMPDFAAQRQAIWGDRTFSPAEVAEMERWEHEGEEG